jgi:hypothetical protein
MSIGDVMFFVTNRAIPRGDQLSFSYIEHEILCESEEKRTAILDMDFKDFDEDDNDSPDQTSNKKQRVASAKRGGKGNLKTGPMIDAVVQNEIMSTQPFERLDLILDLLNNPEPVDPEQDFQCDRYTLHSLRAITLDQLGRCADALPDWQRCIEFATKTFPPIDENTMNEEVARDREYVFVHNLVNSFDLLTDALGLSYDEAGQDPIRLDRGRILIFYCPLASQSLDGCYLLSSSSCSSIFIAVLNDGDEEGCPSIHLLIRCTLPLSVLLSLLSRDSISISDTV